MSFQTSTIYPAEDSWFRYHGFPRGNPFAYVEAEQERKQLPEFYVEVEGYDFIKGEQSTIVFAPRGAGKSALRVVIAQLAAPETITSDILAIEYVNFDYIIQQARHGKKPSIEYHIDGILQSGVDALLDLFLRPVRNPDKISASGGNQQDYSARIERLSLPARIYLSNYTRLFLPDFLTPLGLYELFIRIDPSLEIDWEAFTQAVEGRQLRQFIQHNMLFDNLYYVLLSDLCDADYVPEMIPKLPTEQIRAFCNLAKLVGQRVVYVLIDRVDEYAETANSPEFQVDILEPLLMHLPVLEMPGIAFKFFLAQTTRNALVQRASFRRDRLRDQMITVRWTPEKLKNLLDMRLDYFSMGHIPELTQIFQGTRIEGEKSLLGDWVENQMLSLAAGSPRRLLTAGQLLFQHHITKGIANGQLSKSDWESAREALLTRMPLTLFVSENERVCRIGEEEIALTNREHHIVRVMAHSGGQITRSELKKHAWDTKFPENVSDEAVREALKRLFRKLRGFGIEGALYISQKDEDYVVQNILPTT